MFPRFTQPEPLVRLQAGVPSARQVRVPGYRTTIGAMPSGQRDVSCLPGGFVESQFLIKSDGWTVAKEKSRRYCADAFWCFARETATSCRFLAPEIIEWRWMSCKQLQREDVAPSKRNRNEIGKRNQGKWAAAVLQREDLLWRIMRQLAAKILKVAKLRGLFGAHVGTVSSQP